MGERVDRVDTTDDVAKREKRPRAGLAMVVFGVLLAVWGGANLATYGWEPVPTLIALLGVGLLVAGITVRSLTARS